MFERTHAFVQDHLFVITQLIIIFLLINTKNAKQHLIIHMFHTSGINYISLDEYLNPNSYTIPNMQNRRFFCCSVYIRVRY